MISGINRALAYAGRPGTGAAALLLAAAILALAAAGEPAREWLRYEPAAIASGEVWRLVTGHLVHLGWGHALGNAVGLVLAAAVLGPALGPGRWGAASLLILVAMDGGLWLAAPELAWYVGLSGLLHGWVVAGALVAASRRPLMLGLLIAVAAKIVWEQWAGPAPASEALAGGAVIVEAHLWGGVGGVAAGLALAGRFGPGGYNADDLPTAPRRREGEE